MRNLSSQGKKYYFSQELKKTLEQIKYYPLTLVETPSGFGKTTAIREFIKENKSEGTQEYWYTCLGEPASRTWEGICGLLANIDREKAEKLNKLGMPTADTLIYHTSILKDFSSGNEVYLVVDNFQNVNCEIPMELLSIFSMHNCPNIHIIFITQYIGNEPILKFHNNNIYNIGPSAFFFDKESTCRLFKMEGIRLKDEELEKVFKSTEGWVSAIKLQIINYKRCGTFEYTADIDTLVETAIWDRLSNKEKDFLLSVSILDSFTAAQAAMMIDKDELPEDIKYMLKSNDFIRYFPRERIYTIHSILLDYLRNQFYSHKPREFRKEILRRAGQCYAEDNQLITAARLFLKIEDYDAALSLPFDGNCIVAQRGEELFDIIVKIMSECPYDVLCRHPFVLLTFAYAAVFDGKQDEFQRLSEVLSDIIEKNTAGLSKEDLNKLHGEFIFLQSLMEYNDIKKMSEGLKTALKMTNDRSLVLKKEMPWTFGCTSVLNLFWREPGKLDETIKEMHECLPYHTNFTGGQGKGADSVMRAEAMFLRGDDEQAEIYCHKALYEARSKQQVSICICAELLLARIAMFRGDTEGYFTATENIKAYKDEDSNWYTLRMIETALTIASVLLRSDEYIAKWLSGLIEIEKNLYAPAAPYAQSIYGHKLAYSKKYNEFYGIFDIVMEKAKKYHFLYTQVSLLVMMAVAKYDTNKPVQAEEYLSQAFEIALPDKVYIPFVQHSRTLRSLLEEMSVKSPYAYDVRRILKLADKYDKGVETIRKAVMKNSSPLTPREREVALLAKERLSNREIADRLYISDKTVKTFLQSIYVKLDVHSKSELNLKMF